MFVFSLSRSFPSLNFIPFPFSSYHLIHSHSTLFSLSFYFLLRLHLSLITFFSPSLSLFTSLYSLCLFPLFFFSPSLSSFSSLYFLSSLHSLLHFCLPDNSKFHKIGLEMLSEQSGPYNSTVLHTSCPCKIWLIQTYIECLKIYPI